MNINERLNFLQKVSIFQDIDNPQLLYQLAQSLEEREFSNNEVIVAQGTSSNLLYILVEGGVKVHLQDLQLTELEPGSSFGEIGIFDHQPRSASVTSTTKSKCLVLTPTQIEQAIKDNPTIAFNIIKQLTLMVRHLNRLFGTAEDLFYHQLELL